MVQDGDTITYTFSGAVESEDVSNVDTATVDYCDGAGINFDTRGGHVENAEIDVSNQSTLYLWVGEATSSGTAGFGRYDGAGGVRGAVGGAGSTEVSFSSIDAADSIDAPFLVGSGGAGSSGGGGRGGDASNTPGGSPPPTGGGNISDTRGDGAIDDQNRGLVSGGTTTLGGGSLYDGEIQISYKQSLSPPDPPSNLSAEVQ